MSWRGLRHLTTFSLLACAACCGLACSRASQEDACAADQRDLQQVLVQDQRVGAILHEVDALAASGKGIEASNRIDKAARPQAALAVEQLKQLHPRTRWGEARRSEVRTLLEQRASKMSDYQDALRSDDLARVVTEMTAQRDLERRALAVQSGIAARPDPSTGECAPP